MQIKGYYDAIVIGLGGVGSFALRALVERMGSNPHGVSATRKNLRILGIEQFTPGHRFGTLHLVTLSAGNNG